MSTIVQLQTKADEIVELAHALELAASNNRWDEMGVVLTKIVDNTVQTIVYLSGIDPSLASRASMECMRAANSLVDKLQLDADEGVEEKVDPVDEGEGSVSDEPTITE